MNIAIVVAVEELNKRNFSAYTYLYVDFMNSELIILLRKVYTRGNFLPRWDIAFFQREIVLRAYLVPRYIYSIRPSVLELLCSDALITVYTSLLRLLSSLYYTHMISLYAGSDSIYKSNLKSNYYIALEVFLLSNIIINFILN